MLQMLRKRMDRDEGFTLIELMVVVLIIAILIAIALPTFLGARTRAQNRSAQSDLRNGLSAAKTHYTDGDTYVGFNAAKAATLEGSLTWQDGVTALPVRTVGIHTASASTVVLVGLSASDTYYCIKDIVGAAGGTFYGSGADAAAAVTACTSKTGF